MIILVMNSKAYQRPQQYVLYSGSTAAQWKQESNEVIFHVAEKHIPWNPRFRFLGIDIDKHIMFWWALFSDIYRNNLTDEPLQNAEKFLTHRKNELVFNSFIISHFNYCSMI